MGMLQELELHLPQLGDVGRPEVSKGKKLLNMLKGNKAEQSSALEPAAALVRFRLWITSSHAV